MIISSEQQAAHLHLPAESFNLSLHLCLIELGLLCQLLNGGFLGSKLSMVLFCCCTNLHTMNCNLDEVG